MNINKILESIKSDLLTDDVKEQFNKVFDTTVQATVTEKVDGKIKELETQFETYKEEEIKSMEKKTAQYIESHLLPELNKYLEFAVEEFVKENKLEIDSGIKAEMFDKMVGEMKKVFVSNHIKVNEAEGLKNIESDIKNSKDEYNKAIKENMSLKDEVLLLKAGNIFEKESTDLSVAEKEKLGKLISDFDTDDLDLFKEKVLIVKNNMLKEVDGDDNDNDGSDGGDDGEGDNNFTPDATDDIYKNF